MKSTIALSVLLSGLANGAALAAEVCKPALHNKLARCPTGNAFCTSLLGYTTGEYRTFTISTQTSTTVTVTNTKYIASSTSFITTTIAGVTTTTSKTITVTTPTETLTLPTGLSGSPSCYVSTISETAAGAVPAVKAVQTSCGFNKPASVLSTACSCFIDPIVTATSTVTKTKTTKVTTVPTITLTRYSTLTNTATTTATVASTTLTVQLTACATPPSTCSNTGLQWAYYTAISTGGSDPGNPGNNAGFNPALYKTQTPVINGTTQIIDITPQSGSSGTEVFYGKGPEPFANFAVDHKGYLYAPQTGNYTFYYPYVDDEAYVWTGADAQSGWSLGNYNYYAYWGTSNVGTFTISLTQGQYLPLRVFFAQGTGAGGFNIDITAPDGEKVITSTDSLVASPYFVWHSCDNSAPAFPVWGSET